MAGKPVSVGVDVAKSSLDVAVSNSTEVRRFANDEDGVGSAAGYISALKPDSIIVEATGGLEMRLVCHSPVCLSSGGHHQSPPGA